MDLSKLKAATTSTVKKSDEKEKEPTSDPISEEKKRHKENLMQDIYDQISDEDDEEEESESLGKQNDNPFKEQLKKDAQELKLKQEQEAKA